VCRAGRGWSSPVAGLAIPLAGEEAARGGDGERRHERSTGLQETSVCAERPRQDLSNLGPVLTGLQGPVATLAPAPIAGALIYLQTGQVWPALVLTCLAGRPTAAAQKVAAQWIELLAPPRCWRRPRRRGS
jgi:hypothetical protein